MVNRDDLEARITDEAGSADLLTRLAERVGLNAQARAVFGEPVEREGVVVVPVAKARWGFGGGSGEGEEGYGSGGGAGGMVSPLGYIEIRGDEARFKPIRDPRAFAALGAAGALAALAILRRLR